MRSPEFWTYFDQVARPKLGLRAGTFSNLFVYLDHFDHPVRIVETGCVREKNSWEGDGQSTILFDKYAQSHAGSMVLSIDSDPAAATLCKSLVSCSTRIYNSASIVLLQALTEHPPPDLGTIDLLYLDSLDADPEFEDPMPAAHILKEFLAITPVVRPDTLVVVDDSPALIFGVQGENGSFKPIRTPRIGGKGKLISEYATGTGAQLFFNEYQCGWLGFGPFRTTASPSLSATPQMLHSRRARYRRIF